jgi:hypothetical protein
MNEEHLRRWLDREMGDAEAKAFFASLSEPERQVARALATVATAGGRLKAHAPSEDFVARTMSRVRARRPPRRTFWSWLRAPTLSPLTVFAGAAAISLCVFFLSEWRSRARVLPGEGALARTSPPAATRVVARLSYQAPLAHEVAVAGDFNGWEPQATRMRRGPNGLWTVEVPLPAGGRYQYMFLVDGRWVTDPSAPATLDDGFGGKNGLLEL